MPALARAVRTTTINLRTDRPRRELIDRAAAVLGKNRTEFILDASAREAANVLLDQRLFQLEPKAFKAFVDALDAPVEHNPALRRLMKIKAPWAK